MKRTPTIRPPMPLTKFKHVWRDQVFADQEVSYAAFKLAYLLADFITMPDSAEKYRKHGKAIIWPSQKRLQEKTGMALDTVSVGMAQLISRGHLKRLKRGNQKTGSNKYRLMMQEASTAGISI